LCIILVLITMSQHAPGKAGIKMYGLDKDVQDKIAAKFDPERVALVSRWIFDVTGKKVNNFHKDLKSGVKLCRLMNKIKPGSCKKVKVSKMPFVQRENICNYLEACKRYGMRETDVFVSQDLFEGDNLNNVVVNLFALNTLASKKGFAGPFIGQVDARDGAPKQVDLLDRKEQKEQKEEKEENTKPGPPPPPSQVVGPPKRKPPTGPKLPDRKPPVTPVQAAANATAYRKMPPTPIQKTVEKVGKKTKKTSKPKTTKVNVNKPRRKKKKPKTKLNRMSFEEQQEECQRWIETLTGSEFTGKNFHDSLKDGVLLCKLVNVINPKKKAKFKKKATMPFVARENIAAYIGACKRVGVSEHDLFVTGDLYEGQSMKQVVTNIFALSAKAREKQLISGPFIGAKIADKNVVQDKSGWGRGGVQTKLMMDMAATRKALDEADEKYVRLDNIIKDTEHLAKVYGPKK